MPIAVPNPNPVPIPGIPGLPGAVPGMPGAAYQPIGVMGYPGEAYVGQGFFPQQPLAPMPETPVDMPARRTVFEGPRAQQKAVQGHQKEVIRRWLDTQGKARSAGTRIPEGPTNLNAGTRLNDLGSGANERVFVAEPARPAQPIRYSGGVTTGGPASGGTRVVQAMPGSGAGTVPNGPVTPLAAESGTSQTAARVAANASAGGVGGAARGPGGVRPLTNPNPFPQMTGTPTMGRPTLRGMGRGVIRGMAPAAAGLVISGLGDRYDNSTLRAAGTATTVGGGTAAMFGAPAAPAVAVPAAGVGLGGVLAKPMTGRAQQWAEWMNDPTDLSKLSWGQGDNALEKSLDASIDLFSAPLTAGMAGVSKFGSWLTGGDTSNPEDNPALRGERDYSSLGLGFEGPVSDEEAAQQAAAEQAALPSRLPDIMSEFGLSPETQRAALAQFDQDVRLYRTYIENGLPIPGLVDEDGKPIEVPVDQVEGLVAQQFLQSLPELIDMDRQEQDMLARAAAFQATIGDVMAPYEQQSRALAEMYPSMLVNDNLSPEMRGPMQSYADAMSASTLAQANSYGAAGRMIPMVASLEGYLNSQNQLQSQIDQIIMQQALDEIRNGGGGGDEESLAADALG